MANNEGVKSREKEELQLVQHAMCVLGQKDVEDNEGDEKWERGKDANWSSRHCVLVLEQKGKGLTNCKGKKRREGEKMQLVKEEGCYSVGVEKNGKLRG